MNPPRSIRHVTDEERAALETGLRRQDAFSMRRGPIVFARAEGQQPAQIASTLHGAPPTGRHVMHACDARGRAGVPHGAHVPRRVAPVLHAATRDP